MGQLILQPDATAGIDTWLDSSNPTVNQVTNAGFMVGSGTTDPARFRELCKFDLTSIPVGATILSAILALTQYGSSLAGTFEIHRILAANSSWTEATATWNKRDGTNNWAGSVGCRTSGTDYAATAMYSGDPGTNNVLKNFTLDLTEFGLMWANNYGLIMFGSTITGGGGANPYRFFRSSDYATAGDRPKLTVTWAEPRRRRIICGGDQ